MQYNTYIGNPGDGGSVSPAVWIRGGEAKLSGAPNDVQVRWLLVVPLALVGAVAAQFVLATWLVAPESKVGAGTPGLGAVGAWRSWLIVSGLSPAEINWGVPLGTLGFAGAVITYGLLRHGLWKAGR